MASPQHSETAHAVGSAAAVSHQGEEALLNSEAAVDSKPKDAKISYMSLPNKGQLALLCIARVADPLAATSIQVPSALQVSVLCKLTLYPVVHVLSTQVL